MWEWSGNGKEGLTIQPLLKRGHFFSGNQHFIFRWVLKHDPQSAITEGNDVLNRIDSDHHAPINPKILIWIYLILNF